MSHKDDSVEMSEGIITADSGSVVENKDTQTQEKNTPQATENNPEVEENADQDAMGQLKSKLKKLKEKKKEEEDADDEIVEGDGTFVCGVVEGFYGRPWTTGQRRELFRRMRGMGMNTYLYGPKDDYKHRLYWREPYSADEISLLKLLIDASHEYDILFIYAISPGLDMSFASPKEVECLKNKLLQVQSVGCKAFALLFDDIDPILCAVDKAQYASAAAAQASVTNQMHQVLGEPKFLFCPTEYCSSMAIPDVPNSQYLKTIGDKLNKNISIMWTGPKVVSKHITVESIKQLTRILHRKVVIWDNIHANDYDPKRMFLGPYKGRSTDLIPHLAGVLTNPNCEFESNYIAMHTLASWWKSYLRHKEKREIEEKETPKFEAEEEEKKSDVEMESEEKKDTTATTKVLEGAETVTEEVGEEKKAEDREPSPSQQKDGDGTEEGQKVDVEAKGDQLEAAKKDDPAEVPQEKKQTDQPPDSVPDEPPGNSASRMSSGVSSLIDSDGSDADSDYSSHDDYYVLSRHSDALPFDHGVYDPDTSLKEAIQSWLPYFFASNLPHGKPVARSGPALGMLPHFDVGLVSNAPMGPMSSTTSALTNDPILSTPLPDFEPEQNKRIRVELECEIEHKEAKQEDSVAEVAGEKQDDTVEKASDDVEMAGATPVATPPNATQVSGGDDKSDPGDVKMRSDSDIDMNLSPTSSDQEKKKEEEVKESGDSVEIPIKRIDSALRMETEDDEPMQLEPDHDSDVSMATNNSGEEKKVPKDDTEEKEPAASLSESSVDMMTPPHQPSSPNQTPERDENGTPEHSTPSHEERPEPRAPPIQFKIEPMTREDVELAVELFYLPYEHGGFGLKMVQEFVWLQNNIRQAVMPPNAPPSIKNESMNKAVEWMEHAIQFENCCALIQRMCNKLISCSNRALLYDLFPYFWDMKGVVSMLSSYVKWMGQFYLRRQPAITPEPSESSPSSSKPASPSSSNPSPVAITSSQMPPLPPAAVWLGHDPEPWLFRGGLSGEFQRLLPITMANDLFCQVMPCSPPASNTTYTIRPYLASDEKAVYNICLTTGNDGTDFADDFSGYDDLPGERLVGGLLTLSPEYCFVLEDDLGICGYLVGTVDAKSFWKKHEIAFWPEVKEKYSKMKKEEKDETKVGEDLRRLLDEVANEEPLDSYAVDNLYTSHPAYMQIAVHRRVTDPSIAKSMTVCMLSALKSHGIHGVHTTVRSSDCYMPDLYCRLGFRDIRPFEHAPPVAVPQPTCPSNKADTFIVFGRTF